jgi:DNA-binding NarL/FixJ family response regulator
MNPKIHTLLVIDDEPTALRKIARLLELEGYQVHTAATGREGVAQALRCRPDLILCDITMPDLTGHQVLEQLRRDSQAAAVPFIFLTASGRPHEVRHGMELGADDYLVKPVDLQTLLRAVRARLDRVAQLSGPAVQSFAIAFKSPRPLESLGLSEREAEVLFYVAQGKTNAEVGQLLDISELTVKRHLRNIFDHCGFDNRTAASLRAAEVLGAHGC